MNKYRAKKKARHELKRKRERKLMKKIGYGSDAWQQKKEAIKRRVEKSIAKNKRR